MIDSGKVPSEKACFAILRRFNVPDNIVAHSVKVKDISVAIAEQLIKNGEKIDMQLLVAGALLHDVSKFDCLDADVHHSDHGCRRLVELGISGAVAEIVRKHCLDSVLEGSPPVTWEEKIVFYADKRVNHDKVVSLGERFAYLRKRYTEGLASINSSYPAVVRMEKEIFKNLGITPDRVV